MNKIEISGISQDSQYSSLVEQIGGLLHEGRKRSAYAIRLDNVVWKELWSL